MIQLIKKSIINDTINYCTYLIYLHEELRNKRSFIIETIKFININISIFFYLIKFI